VHCGPGDIRDGQNCTLGSPENAEALGPNAFMSLMGNISQLLPARQPGCPSPPESRAAQQAAAWQILSGSGPTVGLILAPCGGSGQEHGQSHP